MDQQSLHFADFCKKSGVVYNNRNFELLFNYIKSRFPNSYIGEALIPSRAFAACFLDIRDRLEFEPSDPGPTPEQLRAEHYRRLEAEQNIGPLSRKEDPRKTGADSSASDLLAFVKKTVDNLNSVSRGEFPPEEKPKPFRTIPADISPEDLKDGDYSVAEIKDFLARRKK